MFGAPVPWAYSAGVSDANLTCGDAGIPTESSCGPTGGDFHQCTEWVDISSLAPCAELVLGTALRFWLASARLSPSPPAPAPRWGAELFCC